MTTTPTRDELVAFLNGELPPGQLQTFAQRIEASPKAIGLLEELACGDAQLVAQLRQAVPAAQYAAEPGLSAAVVQAMEAAQPADTVSQSGTEPTRTQRSPHAPREEAVSPRETTPLTGRRLRDYLVLDKLGEGGMGAVYKALHERLDKTVAIKILPAERLTDKELVARFEREMKAVGRLDHPNIVRATDAGEADGIHFLVMEYVPGQDLATLVKDRGPLPVSEACEIVRQAAIGLQHAHEHDLVHRDIKPSNIMVTAAGLTKILDLGLARLHADPVVSELTSAGQLMGTIDYMAPEQATDTRAVDIRADIYSLGCTLYKLLAGHAPFSDKAHTSYGAKLVAHATQSPEPITTFRSDVPPALVAILERMLAKNPNDRFATPDEVAAALVPLAGGASFQSTTPSAPEVSLNPEPRTLNPSASRLRWLLVGIAGSLLAALIAWQVIIRLETPHGTVEIRIDDKFAGTVQVVGRGVVRLKDPSDGKTIRVSVSPQAKMLHIEKEGFRAIAKKFDLSTREGRIVEVTFLAAPNLASAQSPASAGFAIDLSATIDSQAAYVDLPDGPPASKACTVEMSVLPRSPTGDLSGSGLWQLGQSLHLKQVGAHWGWFGRSTSRDEWEFVPAPTTFTPHEPLTLAAVSTGKELRLYVNGRLEGKHTLARAITGGGKLHRLGRQVDFAPFDGLIDEIRISSVARYDKDYTPIARLLADGDTWALYHCDEGEGDVLKDSSTHGRHGKLVGAKWVAGNLEASRPETVFEGDAERAAAAWAINAGGQVILAADGQTRNVTRIDDLPSEDFQIVALNLFGNEKIDDAGLANLRSLAAIKNLNLGGTKITSAGLAHLSGLRTLVFLVLKDNPNIGDEGLVHLKPLASVQALGLGGTAVSDDGLAHLAGLSELQALGLTQTKVAGPGLAHLKGCLNLTVVELYGTPLDSAGLTHLPRLPSLTQLDLGETAVDDKCLESLRHQPRLARLRITETQITPAGAQAIREALPDCAVEHSQKTQPIP